MKKYALLLLLVAFGFYCACYITILNTPSFVFHEEIPVKVSKISKEPVDRILLSTDYRRRERELLSFIERYFITTDGGIRTTLKGPGANTGVLSESMGLLMNYSFIREKKDLFQRLFAYFNENLLVDGRYIKWRTGNTACNAVIDDLRILRGLLDAGEEWGVKEYYDTAGFIQEELFARQVNGSSVSELYDWKLGRSRNMVPLCYLDLYTMDRLRVFNGGWVDAWENGAALIKKGRIAGSPFYYKYYDLNSNAYSLDEEAASGKGICLTYTLLTALHLAEMNEDTGFFTEWLKNEVGNGRLFAWYNPKTSRPSQKTESTAVYALAAVYADRAGEGELYYKLIDCMLELRVSDEKSPYYGGFGTAKTKEFHSFDNLTALWALSLAD